MSSGTGETRYGFFDAVRARLGEPFVAVGLVLIAAGVVWAAARGVRFYGWTFVDIGYDLDQPPLLLVFAACWLLYRSRRR